MPSFPRAGFYPFWFWNGEMEPAEIRRQIAEMAAQGVRGFYMHSRQGLRVPYLSAAFFDRVRLAIDCAREHGMQAELYDEYPYPSGVAGGQVILGRPEHQGTRLTSVDTVLDGHVGLHALPAGHVLCARLYPLRADGSTDWAGERDALPQIGMAFTSGSYVETGLTRFNNKRFFEHEPVPTLAYDLPPGRWRLVVALQARVDDHKYWGGFVDVYNPDAIAEFIRLTHARYATELGDAIGSTTHTIFIDETAPGWSPRLAAAYRERTGEDIADLLPALRCPDHPEHLAALVRMQEMQYALFCETFEMAYRDGCHAAGLLYAGEKPAWRLSQLRYMDVPGCDPGHTKAGDWPDCFQAKARSNARAIASAAYFYDKPASLVECYHSLGWTATLQDAKLIADLLLLAGVDMLVPHGFFYSTHGLRKHDAPPSFFFQMPYWRFFGQLSAHVNRLGDTLAGTHVAAEVLVIDPTWGFPTKQHSSDYEAMTRALLAGHCDFLLADTDILEAGSITGNLLEVKDLSVRAIVLPPMRHVEPPLAAWLARWRAAGGTVLETVEACADYARQWNDQYATPAIHSPALLPTGAQPDTPTPLSVRRRGPSGDAVLLINPAAVPQTVTVAGQPIVLAAFESRLLADAPPADAIADLDLAALPCRSLQLLSPNSLRLDRWQLAIAGPATDFGPEATVPAVPLANQLTIGQLAIPPVVGGGFGVPPSLRWPALRLRYRSHFQLSADLPADAHILLEPDSIVGDWTLSLNGNPLTAIDFQAHDQPVHGTLAAPVASYLQAGENRLELRVDTDRSDGGLVNPLYLTVGDQRIRLADGQPPSVAPADAAPIYEAYRANGLPHFVGVLRYSLALPPDLAGCYHPTQGGQPFLDAVRFRVDDGPWSDSLWEPRRLTIPAGAQRLEVELYSALGRHFDALEFDRDQRCVVPSE